MVASSLCAPLLDGPPQVLRVVHRCASACQLADDAGVVRACAVTSAAVRLPHALVLPSLLPEPTLTVGNGRVRWSGHTFSVARWWRPARPHLPTLGNHLRSRQLDDLLLGWRDQLGGGAGLTPYADDVLCGMLVALHAAGDARADSWSAAVLRTPLERHTSATSAALLRLAARGWCIDAVADYLAALAAGTGFAPAAEALRGVGSSSGRGLLEGITTVVGEVPSGGTALDEAA